MEQFDKIDAYLVELPDARSSWKKAQQAVFDEARKFRGTLIRKDDIPHFVRHLQKVSDTQRIPVQVVGPDFKMAHTLDTGTCWVNIGQECYVILRHATRIYKAE